MHPTTKACYLLKNITTISIAISTASLKYYCNIYCHSTFAHILLNYLLLSNVLLNTTTISSAI